jgi:hypothetical protein
MASSSSILLSGGKQHGKADEENNHVHIPLAELFFGTRGRRSWQNLTSKASAP